jgi:hypothetical protein
MAITHKSAATADLSIDNAYKNTQQYQDPDQTRSHNNPSTRTPLYNAFPTTLRSASYNPSSAAFQDHTLDSEEEHHLMAQIRNAHSTKPQTHRKPPSPRDRRHTPTTMLLPRRESPLRPAQSPPVLQHHELTATLLRTLRPGATTYSPRTDSATVCAARTLADA